MHVTNCQVLDLIHAYLVLHVVCDDNTNEQRETNHTTDEDEEVDKDAMRLNVAQKANQC